MFYHKRMYLSRVFYRLSNLIRHAFSLISSPKRLKYEITMFIDYLSFRRRCHFLGEGSSPRAGKGMVLFVSATDWIIQVKMEAILAKALELKGFSPIFLTYRSCKRAQRYFRAFGLNSFMYFDDLMDEVEKLVKREDAQKLLGERSSFGSFLGITYGNVLVGTHALSTLVRRLKIGSSSFGDAKVRSLLAERIYDSMKAAEAAKTLFGKIKPMHILFLEKGYSPYAEIFDTAVNFGLRPVQFHHSQRSDALNFKRYNRQNAKLHPFSLSPGSWERVKIRLEWDPKKEGEIMDAIRRSYSEGIWFDRNIYQKNVIIKTKEEVQKELGLDPAKKTAVVFSHVLWDATFFYGTNLFDDYEQWLVETVKAACENDKVNWVVKLHPDYVWKMKREKDSASPRDVIALDAGIGKLPDHIKVVYPNSPISTYSFFLLADYCITGKGTVGIEISCFGIPVLTAGSGGRYEALGFTIDSKTRGEYIEKIRRIQDIPRMSDEQRTLARKHAYALFLLKPLPIKTFSTVRAPVEKLGSPIDSNIVLNVHSIESFAKAEDLNVFADWLTQSDGDDLITGLKND